MGSSWIKMTLGCLQQCEEAKLAIPAESAVYRGLSTAITAGTVSHADTNLVQGNPFHTLIMLND